jgi:pSer/pThr/pTyr-binding forkhead associated (FHA) protein
MTSADRLPSRFVGLDLGSNFDSFSSPSHLSSINTSSVDTSVDTSVYSGLQDRLGLYQVFLRLYENQRGLLDEILELESAGNPAFAQTTAPYIQGMVMDTEVTLVTNLIHGTTQATTQPQNTWVIGRDSCRVTIALPDRRLSRCHAAVRYVEAEGFYLVDLASSNGSFVNGELVQQSILLKDGDRIRLGSLTFTFFLCQSTHSFQPVHPDLAEMTGNCVPLDPFAQVQTEIELLENNLNFSSKNSFNANPLEDTCSFIRQHYPSNG